MAARPPSNRRGRPVRDDGRSLEATRRDAADCRACPLWKPATQTVFGEGPARARIMLVGEQPGDQEDLAGRPFIGPAGKLLDRALTEAGIDRTLVYVTNAVKHFKFELRGKRRLHKKPADAEIAACLQWLQKELELVAPQLVVAMGASAARALFGRATPIEKNRGKPMEYPPYGGILITVHPSFLLRVPPADRAREYARFVDDLRIAARLSKQSTK
ncbi:MAG TPA: UdgX family uracil-DNA binding protein [Burkholderiales bacterium]|nr:UdgX family uracil-DNA binding protein [Burkholderiales bacterium]